MTNLKEMLVQEFREFLIEYDNENLVVYLSGLDEDDYWIEFDCFDEVNNPEEFAQGYQQSLINQGFTATVIPVEY